MNLNCDIPICKCPFSYPTLFKHGGGRQGVGVGVGLSQTWNLSKSLRRQGFLGENFTRKSANYKKMPNRDKTAKLMYWLLNSW